MILSRSIILFGFTNIVNSMTAYTGPLAPYMSEYRTNIKCQKFVKK